MVTFSGSVITTTDTTFQNAYATLAEYKAYVTARGQTSTTDATDDTVIESLLDGASRFIDDKTQRTFNPFVQTRYFDSPLGSRMLDVDEDLLEVLTVTNGDGEIIPSTEYATIPRNFSPAYAVRITNVSAYSWAVDPNGVVEDAVTVNAIWGYHDDYYRLGFKSGTVTTEALDASETTIDVSSVTDFSTGQIIRIDSELMFVESVQSSALVVKRGINGSTAATHDSGASVKYWIVMQGAKMAVLETARHAYHRRFGSSVSNNETITAAGVVLSPRDIPPMMETFVSIYKKII
jgi:hypothetical protein